MSIFRAARDTVLARIGLIASAEAPSAPARAPAAAPLRESAGVTVVDHDDDQWRPLGQLTDRELTPMQFDRARRLCYYVWNQNPLGNRLIELPLGYLIGKGVTLSVPDDEAQAVLDQHWSDPINAWQIKLAKRLRELAITGEQCWPVFVGGDNFVRIGYIDPERIETVVNDPDNVEQPIGIVLKPNKKGVRRKYRVIVNGPEEVFAETAQRIREEEFIDGECFYIRINDLCGSRRGRGDLVTVLDWLDAYDEFMYGEIDGADYRRTYIWDVLLKGASPEEVKRRSREIQAPRSGDTRVHNENEEWKAVSPDLQSEDAQVLARLIRNHILGGLTLPEHWFGGAAEVNRATGDSMAEPTEKMFEVRQALIGYHLVEIGRFVLRAHWGLLDGREPSAEQAQLLAKISVQWPEMTTKDTTRFATALVHVVSATASAIDAGLLSPETALKLIAALAEQLGVEIDAAKELEAARKAQAERGGGRDDLESGRPPPIDDTGLPSADDVDPAAASA